MRYGWILLLMLGAVAAPAADPVGFTLGLGPAGLLVTAPGDDDQLLGLSVAGTYAISDGLAFRGAVSDLDHRDRDDVSVFSLEAELLAGQGFLGTGPRYWAGLGFFDDAWSADAGDRNASGMTLSLGGGWAWTRTVVDLRAAWRTPEAYHGGFAGFQRAGSRLPLAGGVALSYRF